MKKIFITLGLLVGALVGTTAQITVPHTFTTQTTISSSKMNANFDELELKALNRTGGTITGNITVSGGVTIDGVDISAEDARVAKKDNANTFTARQTISGAFAAVGPILGLVETGTTDAWLSLKRTGGTASEWLLNIPAGATTLQFYNAGVKATLTTSGDFSATTLAASNAALVSGFFDYYAGGGWNIIGAISPASNVLAIGGYRSSQWQGVNLYSNGAQRWGVNVAGDWMFGASNHIADSSGTPTITSGFGAAPAIAGTDYAFVITTSSGSSASGTVTFGHAFTSAPVCVPAGAYGGGPGNIAAVVSVSTTQLVLNGTATAGDKIYVLCRGY